MDSAKEWRAHKNGGIIFMYRPPDSSLAFWGVLLGTIVATISLLQWHAIDRAMKVDQRAWVGPVNVRHTHSGPDTGVRFQFALANSGKTPAFVSTIQKNSVFMDGDLTDPPANSALKEEFTGRAVIFTGQPGIGIEIPAPDYSDADLNAIRDHRKTLNFYRRFEYSDIFGNQHFTKFCYHYVVTWGPFPFEGLTSCRQYNDTDDSKPNYY